MIICIDNVLYEILSDNTIILYDKTNLQRPEISFELKKPNETCYFKNLKKYTCLRYNLKRNIVKRTR